MQQPVIRSRHGNGWLVPGTVGLVIGFALGSFGLWPLGARQPATEPAAAVNPQERALDANLWLQTSAEYRAICLQTYNWMADRLRTRLAALPNDGLPPAVVLDLDETVLDNSPFQSFLDRDRLKYTDELWEVWEQDYPKEVRLVPGAKEFITATEQLGVTVVYISNRLEKYRSSTIAALKNLGLNTRDIDSRLLLKTVTSDKTGRRKLAESRNRVLLLAGDNLRDLSEEFVLPKFDPNDNKAQLQMIQDRLAKVDKAAYRWGTDWFVLPNPIYGEWLKPLVNDPRAKLRPTTMKKPEK
jgi:acid phosphatase